MVSSKSSCTVRTNNVKFKDTIYLLLSVPSWSCRNLVFLLCVTFAVQMSYQMLVLCHLIPAVCLLRSSVLWLLYLSNITSHHEQVSLLVTTTHSLLHAFYKICQKHCTRDDLPCLFLHSGILLSLICCQQPSYYDGCFWMLQPAVSL